MSDQIECSSCGYTWTKGKDGSHSCTERLIAERDALKSEIEAARNQEPVGWILEKSACRAPDDCEDYLEFYEPKEVNEEELKNYLTHGRAFQVFAETRTSLTLAQQAEDVINIGNELHYIACRVAASGNDDLASNLAKLVTRLWALKKEPL